MKKLDGKVVVVTGAGGGLGKAYAKGVAKKAAVVFGQTDLLIV